MIQKLPCGCRVEITGTREYLPPENMCEPCRVECAAFRDAAQAVWRAARARYAAQEQIWDDVSWKLKEERRR
jgi:hypothetical protein